MSVSGYELGTAETFRDFATPFDALKIAEQQVQFAIDPSKGLSRRRYGWFSDNSLFDTTYFDDDTPTGTIAIDTGATSTDTARLRSALAGQYVSQTLAQPGLGLEVDSNIVEYDADGYVSLTNGIIALGAGWHDRSQGGWGVAANGGPIQTFLGRVYDTTGAYAVLVANGQHLGNSPVPQDQWSEDVMNGADDADNPSGRQLRPDDGQISNWPYTWYAFGALYDAIIDPATDKPIAHHQFNVPRSSFDRPNLTPMVVLDNDGTASELAVDVGGVQFALYGADIEGEAGEERALEPSRVTSANATGFISDQVAYTDEAIDPNAQIGKPVLAIRRESGVRDLTIRMDGLKPEPENDIYLYAFDEYDPATALDGTFREPNEPRHSSETHAEVNTTCTSYTPTTAVARGWDKATTEKKNERTLVQVATDDRIPVDATRVYTAVHDGTTTDAEVHARAVEGF